MCPAKGSHNILKHNHQNSNSRPPYWGRKMLSNWRWTFPIGVLSKCAKSKKRRPMLRPERDEIRLGFHKCLGSRKPTLCPERDGIRSGFHKCSRSRRLMLYPERDEIRLGFHEGLGYRRPMLRPERDEIRSGFHKCFRCKRLMLYPDRDEIRLGFHKCLGSRRRMFCPERDENLYGSHMCLGSLEARLRSALSQQAGRGGASPFVPKTVRIHHLWRCQR